MSHSLAARPASRFLRALTGANWMMPANLGTVLVLASVCAPVLAIVALALAPGSGEQIAHLSRTILPEAVLTTALLLVGVALLAGVLGVGAAWLVTMTRFPGRSWLQWGLVLPLAIPPYLAAYALGAMFDPGGAMDQMLRALLPFVPVGGLSLRSLPGAILVFALTCYPYVYLSARASFAAQSVCALEAARTLGASPWQVFWRVGLPAARPAIAAGLALVLMETAADYGAVAHLGQTTIAATLFHAWLSLSSTGAAARLGLMLVVLALVLVGIERAARGRQGYAASSQRWRTLPGWQLSPARGWLASFLLGGLFGLAFLLPVGHLIWLCVQTPPDWTKLALPALHSMSLAALAACLVVVLGVLVASGRGKGFSALGLQAAATGYAIPGAVLALGAIVVTNAILPGLGQGSAPLALAALMLAYTARFAASALQPIDAAFSKAPASLSQAAFALGAGPWRQLLTISLPLMRPGVMAAALTAFVETIKELPATLILRPFDFETLATRAYAYASDERLTQAAPAALAIIAVGVLPMIALTRAISDARPGAGRRAP